MTMSFVKLSATAALGLCLGVLPLSAQVQSADAAMENETNSMFVPMVALCTDSPDVESCGAVRTVVTECAAELTLEFCDVLFEDAEMVFSDPDLMEDAKLVLTSASEAIADMEFDEPTSQIEGAIEATRANSERTMLRGDENLNSHSSPATTAD
ncbi:MAG: hypothetical protein ACK41Y_15075 [Paracoccus hibiscisoli]|uniref:hypothetical protein n=1 Tax=Paracoccus hibiscisoli TaxID=2023261 RepID=UPI003919AA4F